MNKYAILDRDGTLIFEPQDSYQIDDVQTVQILPGVIRGLQVLQKLQYRLLMVTNQDGLGTSSFPIQKFSAVQNRLIGTFSQNGIVFDRIFVCPHFPNDFCNCRKPKTGLIDEFLQKNPLNKTESFVCGDRISDRQFAKSIGIAFVAMKTNSNFYTTIENGLNTIL